MNKFTLTAVAIFASSLSWGIDLMGGWSGSSNPTPQGWSYGYRDNLADNFHLFDQASNDNHFHFWRSASQGFTPALGRNDVGTQYGVPYGNIGLLPSQGKFVSARVNIELSRPYGWYLYWRLHPTSASKTDVYIRINGVIVFRALDSNVIETGILELSNLHNAIELLVGEGSDGSSGDGRYVTNREFNISSPEPGSVVAVGLGLAAVALRRRRSG